MNLCLASKAGIVSIMYRQEHLAAGERVRLEAEQRQISRMNFKEIYDDMKATARWGRHLLIASSTVSFLSTGLALDSLYRSDIPGIMVAAGMMAFTISRYDSIHSRVEDRKHLLRERLRLIEFPS